MLYLAATADDNAGFDFSADAETLHRAAATKDKATRTAAGLTARDRSGRRLLAREDVDRELPREALARRRL
jgi:hypothetical protein